MAQNSQKMNSLNFPVRARWTRSFLAFEPGGYVYAASFEKGWFMMHTGQPCVYPAEATHWMPLHCVPTMEARVNKDRVQCRGEAGRN